MCRIWWALNIASRWRMGFNWEFKELNREHYLLLISIFLDTVPDNVHQLHVYQPSTYEKPKTASAVLGSRWWAVCRPKHVELHINMKWKFWYNVASWWIFCVNYTMMHVSTNIKLYKLFQTLWSAVKLLMTDYTYSGVAFCLSQRKVSIKMHSILAVNLDGDWCFQCQQVLEKSW